MDISQLLDSLAAKGANELTNESVLRLQHYLTKNNLKFSNMVTWINLLLSSNYNEKHLKSTLKKLVQENRLNRKSKRRRPQELQQFLTSPFLERVSLSSQHKSTDESATTEDPSASKVKVLQESIKKYQDALASLKIKLRSLTAKYETASKQKASLQNKNDYAKNEIARLRNEIFNLSQSIERQKKMTESQFYKKNYALKQINKKRLSENNALKKQVSSLKEKQVKLKAEKIALQKTINHLKKKV